MSVGILNNIAHNSNLYLHLHIEIMYISKLIPRRPHMIVIAYGPDSTIPGVYVLTLVILVFTKHMFLEQFLNPREYFGLKLASFIKFFSNYRNIAEF